MGESRLMIKSRRAALEARKIVRCEAVEHLYRMVMTLLHDLVEAVPLQHADALEGRVEVQVGHPALAVLARRAVQNLHVHEIGHERWKAESPLDIRTHSV